MLLVALAPKSPIFGLGIRLPNQDPIATARGNAFAATADNASAIYYNPAGIAQLEQPELRVSAYSVRVDNEYRSNGAQIDNEAEWQHVPAIYFASPIEDRRMSWGISVNVPYGQSSEWPEDAPFNSIGVEGEVRYLSVSPAIAAKVNDWLYLGGAVHFDSAELELQQVLPLTTLRTRVEGDSFAVSGTFGALMRFDAHSIGLTYRFQTIHDVDGKVKVPGVGQFDYRSKVTFPDHLILGYAYRIGNWTLEANVDWTAWSKFDNLDLGVAGTLPFEWQNSFFYEIGAQWASSDGATRINFGYTFNENSIPDEFFNPLIVDSDRHFLSAGLEQALSETWTVSATVQYGWSVDRKVKDAIGNGFQDPNGEYSTRIIAFNVGVNARF